MHFWRSLSVRTRNLLQLNFAILMWGGTAQFAKGIKLPVANIICIRSLIGAASLLIFLLITKERIKVKKTKDYGLMAVLGILLCMHWLTYFKALKISTTAVAILSLHTYPVFTALVEPLFFRTKLKGLDVILAVFVFFGILIMIPEISLSNTVTQGILLGIISGLFFMARNLLIRKYIQQYSSSTLMFYQILVAGVILIPFLSLSDSHYTAMTWNLLILLGVIFTAFPHTLFAASFKSLTAKTVGIIATLLPFYGTLFAYFIYDEKVALRTLIGGAVILSIVLFETVRSAKK